MKFFVLAANPRISVILLGGGDEERMKNWSMFAEIQSLKTLGYKRSKVAEKLKLHFYTVDKYWDMEPEEFALKLEASKTRIKKPDKYREEILALLKEFPDMTASQLYDWLEERRQSNLPFSERTMRLYIADLRIEEDIPKPRRLRQYEAVDDPPMGAQAQVDMGEIWLKDSSGKRVKVYCFAMVLSHSRYKYVCWQTMPFTTETFIESHEKAFAFLGGRTAEIVYDQDKILAVSENYGDIIYTEGFQSYLAMMKFKVYLCRGFDPESKGRVEAVVKFAKKHFANHRTFIEIESFNADCIAWLHRKGNGRKHQITQKIPAEVFKTERDYLSPVSAYEAIASSNSVSYQVRKDNTVLYKSNRYRLPKGTYQPGKRVLLRVDGVSLIISDTDTNVIYARHTISLEKGRIINLNHAEREQNKTQEELHQKVLSLFPDNPDCEYFLDKVKEGHKRYYKDQLSLIRKVSEQAELKDSRYKALEYCLKHKLFSATEFKAAIEYFNELKLSPEVASPKKGLSSQYPKVNPKVRDINEYKKLMEG